VHDDSARFRDPVKLAMSQRVETLLPSAGFDTLLSTLDRGMVAVIAEGDRLHGLITRFDLLNHLRRKL
jgi:cystathionine beta-synthase